MGLDPMRCFTEVVRGRGSLVGLKGIKGHLKNRLKGYGHLNEKLVGRRATERSAERITDKGKCV